MCERFWNERKVKVCADVFFHADFFHDSNGGMIVVNGEGNDLRQLVVLKAVMQKPACRFCRVPIAPKRGKKLPPNFNAGRE